MINKPVIILIFLVAFFKTTLFSFYGFGLVDEGESLHNAQRILEGDIPYRDFFAIFPPMDNYYFALIFKLFGESVLIPRIISSIIFSFTPVLIFLICKRFAPTKLSTIPAILITFSDVNIERLYIFTPIFLGVYLYLQAVNRKKKWLFGWSGFMLGLSSLIRLDIPGTFGVSAVIVLAAYLFLTSHKNWIKKWFIYSLYMGVGFGLPIMLMIAWMINLGIVDTFINMAFFRAVIITNLHHLPFPSLFDFSSLSDTFTAYYGYAILATYLVSGFLILRKTAVIIKENIEIPLFFLAGILTLPYIFGRSDLGHLIKGGTPFLILGIFILINIRSLKIRLIPYGLIFILFVGMTFQSIWWLRFNDQKVTISSQILNLNSEFPQNSTKPSAKSLNKSVIFLQENSIQNEPVLILPYMAGLYFLSNRPSATQFNNLLAGFINSDEEQHNFIDKIEVNNVRIVVYDPNNGPRMKTARMQDYNVLIHKYLMEKFQIVEQTPEGWLFMKKKI